MAGSGNRDSLAVQLSITNSTVNNVIVRTGGGTTGSDLVLNDGVSGGVTGSLDLLVGGVIASRAVLVCVPTSLGTGGSLSLNLGQSVAEFLYQNLTTNSAGLSSGTSSLRAGGVGCGNLYLGGVIASRAVLICVPTSLDTGGSHSRNPHQSMAGSRDFHNIAVAALGTGVGGVTLSRTSGSDYVLNG